MCHVSKENGTDPSKSRWFCYDIEIIPGRGLQHGGADVDGRAASRVRQNRRHGRQHGASKSTVDMMMSIVSTIVSTEKPNDSASMGEKWT